MRTYKTGKDNPSFQDITGQKFGKLTAVNFVERDTLRGVAEWQWQCKCECGQTTHVRKSNLTALRITKCKFCSAKETAVAKTLPNNKALINRILRSYKKGAAEREFEFSLSLGRFKELIKQDCFYCGEKPRFMTGDMRYVAEGDKFERNGIDRVNSKLGYIEDNVVSCCTSCNVAKLDKSKEEFVAWVKTLYENLVKSE